MEPFKLKYNKKTILQIGKEINKHSANFDMNAFTQKANHKLTQLEMKQRVVQISNAIHLSLKGTYKQNIRTLTLSLKSKKNPQGLEGFLAWPISEYIESHGINDLDTSMKAMYKVTKVFTSEFCIRPFLEMYPEETYNYFSNWINDSCEHIRRWITEGTRPNLPWGKRVSHLKANFNKNLMILEKLKNDPSLYVRTSVANHLNDISHYDARLVKNTLHKWLKTPNDHTLWIVKKALRTLIKKGDAQALNLIGYSSKQKYTLTEFQVTPKKIKEGESLNITFKLKNPTPNKAKLFIDYLIGFRKANGKISDKNFHLKKITLEPHQEIEILKKVKFKKVTTRKHYVGKHTLSIQVNGNKAKPVIFQLTKVS